MLRFWCVPFYYNQGYGLGDISDEEDPIKKEKKPIQIDTSNPTNNNNNSNDDNYVINLDSKSLEPLKKYIRSPISTPDSNRKMLNHQISTTNEYPSNNSSNTNSNELNLADSLLSSVTSISANSHTVAGNFKKHNDLQLSSSSPCSSVKSLKHTHQNLINKTFSMKKKASLKLNNNNNSNQSLKSSLSNLVNCNENGNIDNVNIINSSSSNSKLNIRSHQNSLEKKVFIQLQEQVISDEKIYDKNLSKSSDLIRKTSVRDITSSRSKSFRNKFKKMLLSKNSKSQSPSKSYDEESDIRRMNYLNNYFFYNTSRDINDFVLNKEKIEQQSKSQLLFRTPSPKSSAKLAARSFDTYKGYLQKINKEQAIDLDDDDDSFSIHVPNTSNSNHSTPNSILVNNFSVGSNLNLPPNMNQSPSLANRTPKSNLKKLQSAVSFNAPSIAIPSPLSSPSPNRKLERTLTKDNCVTNPNTQTNANTPYGKICMRVLYDSNTHVLTVAIIQSNRVLPVERQKQYSKILFHITLHNTKHKSPKYKTSTKEYFDYINFNESFYFPNIDKKDVEDISIFITLCGKETFSSDKRISQAVYPLDTLELNDKFKYVTLHFEEYKDAKKLNKQGDFDSSASDLTGLENDLAASLPFSYVPERPELLIGLKYDALVGSLFVTVVKGKYLCDRNSPDKSLNTFVRLVLNVENTEVKFQTAVKKSSSKPVYDETFEFNLDPFQVENAKLIIYVYSKKLLSSKSLLGCIIFDDQPGHVEYVAHLREAITSDGKIVLKWHNLAFSA